jgi:methylmalonyl-CoA mutase
MAKKRGKSGGPGSEADRLTLAAGFPPSTDEAWQRLVKRILGDRDVDAELVRRTYDGIAVRPLYTAADWRPENEASGFPGLAPFTRGHRPIGHTKDGWDIRQLHTHPDCTTCNREILEDIGRGVTSVELRLDRTGADGVMVDTIDDLDAVLDGVYLDACPVSLRAGAAFLPAASMLLALLERRGVDAMAFVGALNADPLAALAAVGALPQMAASALEQLGALARHVATACPAATAVAVDTTVYHDAGASEAQELACALAAGAAYLRAMTAAGLDLDAAFGQIAFTFAADANLFLSIAKLRAARRLWGRVAEACGQPRAVRHMRLHATTSARMLSRRDPWVNILRGTVAALAASVAGVDSLTVLPFTAAIGLPDVHARRIARNTQLVLQQESSLSRVIDPAGGSWAIENVTEDLAREAWRLFQEIEREGGLPAALASGSLQARIVAVAETRVRRIGALGDPLTGISAFPNLGEQPVSVEQVDREALRRQSDARGRPAPALDTIRGAANDEIVAAMLDAAAAGAPLDAMVAASARGPGATATPLARWRLGEAFEALRDASDAWLEKNGKRPTVYLATIGPLARFTTAASYARNFLAAGGIDAVTGEGGTDADAIAAAFRSSGLDIAVICSDAAGLAEFGSAAAAALAWAGAREIDAVGRPAAAAPVAGVKEFLYEGCDVLAVLRGLMERMGVLDR